MDLFPGAVRIERVLGTPERRPLPGDVRCLAHRIPCLGGGRLIRRCRETPTTLVVEETRTLDAGTCRALK